MIDETAGISSPCTVSEPEAFERKALEIESLELEALAPRALEPESSEPESFEPVLVSPRTILIEFITEVREGNVLADGRETLSSRLDIEVTEFGYRHLVAPIEFARQFEPAPLSDAAQADIADEWLSLLP
jgi:hypothetical protein